MTNTETVPSIYVGTYAKYNNGSINGALLKLTNYADSKEFYEACKELHKDEIDPEYMFQDYEGFPESLYSESGNIDEIYQYLDFINDNNIDAASFEAYMSLGNDLEYAIKNFDEAYQGKWNSEREFCEYLFDETNEIPSNLTSYIDYERVSRDYMYDHTFVHGYMFRDV